MQRRHRSILYLISQYLSDFGLKKALNELINEANLTSNYRVCDNIDLDTMYLDYCNYYALKFGKQPKILRRDEGVEGREEPRSKPKTAKGKPRAAAGQQEIGKERPTDELVMTGEAINAMTTRSIDRAEPINFHPSFSAELQDLADAIERYEFIVTTISIRSLLTLTQGHCEAESERQMDGRAWQ